MRNLHHLYIMYCVHKSRVIYLAKRVYARVHSAARIIISVNSTPALFAYILRTTRLNGNAGGADSRIYISCTRCWNECMCNLHAQFRRAASRKLPYCCQREQRQLDDVDPIAMRLRECGSGPQVHVCRSLPNHGAYQSARSRLYTVKRRLRAVVHAPNRNMTRVIRTPRDLCR